jgi:uncharacterized protein YjbJ (UPF0337 family)
MNMHQITGRADQVTGRLKQLTGRLLGNHDLQSAGRIEQSLGSVDAIYGDAMARIKRQAAPTTARRAQPVR